MEMFHCFVFTLLLKPLTFSQILPSVLVEHSEVCHEAEYVPLPQVSLDSLQNMYNVKYRQNADEILSVIKNRVFVSKVSTHLQDIHNTGIICGALSNTGKGIIEKDPDILEKNISQIVFPWVVYIRTSESICGGVLISDSWVLTSARCAYDIIHIYLGSTNVERPSTGLITRIAKVEIVHGQYRKNLHGHDIGLIHLDEHVIFNDYIRPICVPETGADFHPFKCFVANWGRHDAAEGKLSDDIHVLSVFNMEEEECHFRWVLYGERITKEDICLGFREELTEDEKCNQDTAGPMICNVNETFFVAGITGNVKSRCTYQFLPDRFTRVSAFENWLLDQVTPDDD